MKTPSLQILGEGCGNKDFGPRLALNAEILNPQTHTLNLKPGFRSEGLEGSGTSGRNYQPWSLWVPDYGYSIIYPPETLFEGTPYLLWVLVRGFKFKLP